MMRMNVLGRTALMAAAVAAIWGGAQAQARPAGRHAVRQGVAAGQGQSTPGEWRVYANARFGFAVCYPSAMLRPAAPPDNGDGQTFRSNDGAELRVFGSNNVLEKQVRDEALDQARSLAQGGRLRPTYQVSKPGWAVVSGTDGRSNVLYVKVQERAEQFIVLQLRYPLVAAARYRPVLERMARCLAVQPPSPGD